MRDTLAIPTIHANGTSRAGLLAQHTAVIEALDVAIAALSNAAPHGRDYYPQGVVAHMIAATQHSARLNELVKVRNELYHIAEAIA